jgi:hypothetical protein
MAVVRRLFIRVVAASNQINVGVRDYALELVRQNYRDFGPTLTAEAYKENFVDEVT